MSTRNLLTQIHFGFFASIEPVASQGWVCAQDTCAIRHSGRFVSPKRGRAGVGVTPKTRREPFHGDLDATSLLHTVLVVTPTPALSIRQALLLKHRRPKRATDAQQSRE